MREMKLWFIKQGHPERVVEQGLGKVMFSKLPRKTNKEIKMYI